MSNATRAVPNKALPVDTQSIESHMTKQTDQTPLLVDSDKHQRQFGNATNHQLDPTVKRIRQQAESNGYNTGQMQGNLKTPQNLMSNFATPEPRRKGISKLSAMRIKDDASPDFRYNVGNMANNSI